jgi:hypothetical protein
VRKEMLVLRASSGFGFVPPDGRIRLRLVTLGAVLVGCLVCGLSGPAAGSAQSSGSLPVVGTGGVDVTGATTAIVVGVANPEGQSTTIHADYALADELWCTSNGKEGAPSETIPENLGSGNTVESEVPVSLEGLIPASEYCVELVATNASGTAYGDQVRFTTPPAPEGSTPPANLSPSLRSPLSLPPISVTVGQVRVAGNSVVVTARCQGTNRSSCYVLERLSTSIYRHGRRTSASQSAGNRRIVIVARKSFSIAFGQTKTFALSLNSTGRRLLAHFHILPTQLSAVLTNAATPQVVASKVITFTHRRTKQGK